MKNNYIQSTHKNLPHIMSNENNTINQILDAYEPTLLFGTNTASSTDWPTMVNPTGWGKSAEHLNVEKEGLVGHCWKSLTVTTEYPSIHTINGLQTDSNHPFSIEHSINGEEWISLGCEFTGDNKDIEQTLEPFACRYIRMEWATTYGTNGIHAQFVGVEGEYTNASKHSNKQDTPCVSSTYPPCIENVFLSACEILQKKISVHLEQVEEREKSMEDKYRSEYNENNKDWDERLEEGVRDFKKHYEEQISILRETLYKKKQAHEARLAEIEQAFLVSRQESLDIVKQRMQDKLVKFEDDLISE